ncbi:uncharacterized protein LOC131245158 [Magnolia sinica]|uniref:uncharacterized protein LOC131245158 n=1 Tax=Magnolia sinica TaxID=86752 RepID=UPI00265B0423|nr:uncharacterized protein LOC131245158 [Magnolia sinica]
MPTTDKYEILKVKGGKIITLLRSVSHVKVIQLSGFTAMYLCWATGHMNFPSFVDSKKLIIQVDLSQRMGVCLLSKLLQNFPSLEELEFWSHNNATITRSAYMKKVSFNSCYWEKQRKHFHFLNSTLKRVVIEDLKGDIFNFYFSKFLIGSAKVLEHMTVRYSCLAARNALKRQFSLGDVASSDVELSIFVKKSEG